VSDAAATITRHLHVSQTRRRLPDTFVDRVREIMADPRGVGCLWMPCSCGEASGRYVSVTVLSRVECAAQARSRVMRICGPTRRSCYI